MSADLYTGIADTIRGKLLGIAPPGYRIRIQVIWAICGLKFCLACISMALTFVDLRRRGRRLRLVHFQRLQNGKILVLNSLFLYVLVSALSSIYFALVQYQNWQIYFKNGSPRNLVMMNVQCWTPIFLAAYVFTSGNIAALLMMPRKSRGFETASRVLILLQNGTLIGILLLYFASTIPMSILTNNRANALIEEAVDLMTRLYTAGKLAQAGRSVTSVLPEPLGEIIKQSTALQARQAGLNKWIDGLLAIAVFFCTFFAAAAVASLRFVLQLRRESQRAVSTGDIDVNGTMALRSINVTQTHAITIDHGSDYIGVDSKMPLSPSTPRSAAPFSSGLMVSTKTATGKPLSAETVALARLSNDLMMATPLVLASCFVLPCLAFWGWIAKGDSWVYKELRVSGLVWAELAITTPLLLFFVYNHLANPSRYGHGQAEEIRTIGGRVAPPGFEFRIATQQERVNKQSDDAETVDRVYLPHLGSADGEITPAEPSKVWFDQNKEKEGQLWR